MDLLRRTLRLRVPELHVILLPTATVTTLLAANPHEGVEIVDLRAPMLTALCVAALAWFLSGRFITERRLRSLVATMSALLPLLSGYLFGWLRVTGLSVGSRASLEVALLTLAGMLGLAGLRRIKDVRQASTFLNLFACLVIVLAVPSILGAADKPQPIERNPTALPDTSGLYRPDIYLIILDAYSGLHSLSEFYGFDNTPFLAALRQRGFTVPETLRSNYVKTFLSIGSMLNRDYYERLTPPASDYPPRAAYNTRMERNRTAIDLLRLGYRFHYAGSSYPPLSTNRLANEQFEVNPSKEFEQVYFQSTLLPPLYDLCMLLGECRPPELPFKAESAADSDRRIEYLLSRIEEPGPKFVYAHWLLPHGPYRFDANCDPTPSRWTVGKDLLVEDSTAQRLYIGQLECTNVQLLRVVDAVQSLGRNEAVIILQSDHGNGRFPGDMPKALSRSTTDQVTERFDIFAAYYGPGSLADSLAAAKSPINTMRALFRVLWGVNEPPLRNRYFWSEGEQPLHLVELMPEQLDIPASGSTPSR
jgi:hypothetical protein